MSYLSNFLAGPNSAGPGFTTLNGTGAMKASILLFDIKSGTRSFTPSVTGRYRVAVVGGGSIAGGGYSESVFTLTAGTPYSYTVGAAAVSGGAAGTSSFNAAISATGANGVTPGTGSSGTINTSGGIGVSGQGGGASGHRFGDGGKGGAASGGGWMQDGNNSITTVCGGCGGVDGFGLGLVPGPGAIQGSTASNPTSPAGYGGGGAGTGTLGINAGIGGGAGIYGNAGIGGGADGSSTSKSGNGAVIVEILG